MRLKAENIELNDEFRRALELMESPDRHVFVTGKAGTGKSTLLSWFRQNTRRNVVVLAPTGVAAINVDGQTIHSFFGFKPGVTPGKIRKLPKDQQRLLKEVDAIVIDEVSMVRADLLDCVDRSLRKNGRSKAQAFGGVKMVFIGDLYQLPPVVTPKERPLFEGPYASPYFFSAEVFRELKLEFVELEKIYRQKDNDFIGILNALRNNSADGRELTLLNSRVGQKPEAKRKGRSELTVHLVPTNAMAQEINAEHLRALHTRTHVFPAEVDGTVDRSAWPADGELELAVGAQVMFLNNDSLGRWVNGTMGRVSDITRDDDAPRIIVELEDGEEVDVERNTWDVLHYEWDEERERIEAEKAGAFTQYPLRLAWAITIHKSQGKTFDRVVIDMGRGAFAHGQTYVALSRARTLEGVGLKVPIKKTHLLTDWRVVKFMTSFQYERSESAMPLEEKMAFLAQAAARKSKVRLVYLKANGDKSRRVVTPRRVGAEEYQGKEFPGLLAFCHARNEERMFRVDRILELAEE
ncbi:MAG: AAA family ATPase [Candidatus Omnitrophica bacterium]|nr:AAA family ATPase [Candidatus Omnitrophota bacterium]